MLTPKGRILTCDIEAVGLVRDVKKREDVHIIHLKDYDTGELFTFFDDFDARINAKWLDEYEEGYKHGDILEGVRWMNDCEILIMHNISGFDALAIERAFPGKFTRNHFQRINHPVFPYKTCDTLVMSYLLNPERKVPHEAYQLGLKVGAHGIAAYGVLMGRFKPEHEDWTHLSKEMIHRVEEDVEIGEWTFNYLMKEWREQLDRPNKVVGKDISHAYWCELRMGFTVARQALRGFAVDVKYIAELLEELNEKINATEKAFRPHMPMRLKMKKLTDAQIEKSAENLGALASEYENYMYNGDQRASYAATNWSITTKAGKYGKNVTKYIPEAVGYIQDYDKPPVHGPFTPLVWEEIPLGNRDAVKQILFKHGWLGVNYNDTELEYMEENNGELPKPWAGKIDDDSLLRWEESEHEVPEWCKGIAAWYVLVSRRTQLLNPKDLEAYDTNGHWPRQTNKKNECRGILPKAFCADKGEWFERTAEEYYEKHGCWPTSGHWRVPAVAFHCATNTFRMRHRIIVNIPSRGLYGKEMRKVFIAGPGKKILGCDGSGLELRMLAHFMNNAMYTSIVLNGDIHSYNQEMAGLSTRDMAKKFIYMFLYGSGIPNLARQIGMSEHEMSKCVAQFKASLPDLDNLLVRVEKAGKKFGYLMSVDGRWGRIRSKNGKLALNTALNVLLQMTGSLVMKWAHTKVEDLCVEWDVIDDIKDFPIVAHVHDEGQMEIDEDEIEVMVYTLKEEEGWKEEEKRQHIDEQGRIWSAPTKCGSWGDDLMVERQYHPIGDAYCKALKWAGEELHLRIETAGEYKIGDNWSETH